MEEDQNAELFQAIFKQQRGIIWENNMLGFHKQSAQQ